MRGLPERIERTSKVTRSSTEAVKSVQKISLDRYFGECRIRLLAKIERLNENVL